MVVILVLGTREVTDHWLVQQMRVLVSFQPVSVILGGEEEFIERAMRCVVELKRTCSAIRLYDPVEANEFRLWPDLVWVFHTGVAIPFVITRQAPAGVQCVEFREGTKGVE